MHILSARLSNFRSFHSDQFLTFGHSNIFVGRNGSGKSSLLSALLSSLLPSAHSSILPNSFVELRISNNNSFAGLPSIFSLSVRFSPSPLYFLDSHPLSSSLFFLICELLGISQSIAIHQSVSSNSDIYPCSINSLGSLSPHSRLNLIINSLGVSNYDIRKLKAIKCLNIDINTINEQINERKNELKNEIKKGKEKENKEKRKAEIEYEMMKWEMKEIEKEIEKEEKQSKEIKIENEGMLEIELEECRERMNKLEKDKEEIKGGMVDGVSDEIERWIEEQKKKKGEIEKLEKKREEISREIGAVRCFNAIGTKVERVSELEGRLERAKAEAKSESSSQTSKLRDRRGLWIKERELKEEIEILKRRMALAQDRIVCVGHGAVTAYESIKEEEGVIGPVHALLNVPRDVEDAFESVARARLFWIVVENEEVAFRLVERVSVAFIALNRLPTHSKAVLDDPRLVRLAKALKPAARFAALAEYVCRGFYVTATLEDAVELSGRYNANVVTAEGEVMTRNGILSGGAKEPIGVLREMRNLQQLVGTAQAELGCVRDQLSAASWLDGSAEDSNDRPVLGSASLVTALEWKLQLVKERKLRIPDEKSLLSELRRVEQFLTRRRTELQDLLKRVPANERIRLERHSELKHRLAGIINELDELKKRETEVVDKLYGAPDCDNCVGVQRRHILMDRKAQLAERLGIKFGSDKFINLDEPSQCRDLLLSELRTVNRDLRQLAGSERASHMLETANQLHNRIADLNNSKYQISALIDELEIRRAATLSTSFDLLIAYYSEYFNLINKTSLPDSKLSINDDGAFIMVDNEVCDTAALSGGQRSIIALSLVLALSRVVSLPFLFLDEIDANLDAASRAALYGQLRLCDAQLFITTFREEALLAGDKFFGVVASDGASNVCEITSELAAEMIRTAPDSTINK